MIAALEKYTSIILNSSKLNFFFIFYKILKHAFVFIIKGSNICNLDVNITFWKSKENTHGFVLIKE